jgi:predicted nucleic acid-binding protein
MLFLLDANALSDIMNGHPVLAAHMAARQNLGDQFVTSVIAWGEICFGIERLADGKRKAIYQVKVQAIAKKVSCREVPVSAADHYARIKRDSQRRGRPLDENDLWIAATAAALGAVLVSRDLDFSGVAAIQIEDWTKP